MEPWTHDALNIGEISENDLVITPQIDDFLKPIGRDHMNFVVAPKGIGKTFVLMYKRQLYEEKHRSEFQDESVDDDVQHEVYFIPRNQQLDRSYDFIPLSIEKENILEDYSNWTHLWKFFISLSIYKNILKYYKPKSKSEINKKLKKVSRKKFCVPETDDEAEATLDKLSRMEPLSGGIRDLIKDNDILTPYGHLNAVLDLNYSDIIKCISLQKTLGESIKINIRFSVLVFIDNIDQHFEYYLHRENPNSILYRNIWYASQIGLIKAIYELSGTMSMAI